MVVVSEPLDTFPTTFFLTYASISLLGTSFLGRILVKRTLKLFFFAATPALLFCGQPSLAMQSNSQPGIQSAQHETPNAASAHDRHHRHHSSGKHRHHHHSSSKHSL